jgi:hypothetical protein
VSKETASFERKLNCKAPKFQILVPRFYHDPEGKAPAGTTLLAGETLHYALKVAEIDKSRKKSALVMRATILAADGKDLGTKPLEIENRDPAKPTFNGSAAMNRAGEFRLRIVVEETHTGRTAMFETPIKVLAP